jgi:hypothetical protein
VYVNTLQHARHCILLLLSHPPHKPDARFALSASSLSLLQLQPSSSAFFRCPIMVALTAKALLLPLLGAASISALPLPAREAELVRRVDLDLEPKITVGLNTNINVRSSRSALLKRDEARADLLRFALRQGETDSYSVVVAPVISPEVLDNPQVSNVLTDLVGELLQVPSAPGFARRGFGRSPSGPCP